MPSGNWRARLIEGRHLSVPEAGGRRPLHLLHETSRAGAVLSAADLYIVPAAWLRGIEPWDTAPRAERAAALVTAHRQRPIEHLLGHRQLELLFPL